MEKTDPKAHMVLDYKIIVDMDEINTDLFIRLQNWKGPHGCCSSSVAPSWSLWF